MNWVTLTLVLSAIGVLVVGYLAFIFWRDPEDGLRQATHRRELLPLVLADRYTSMTVLALAATLYRDLNVIVVLFAVFSFMGYADAVIYFRKGHPMVKHLLSGIAATVVVVVALIAMRTGVPV
jgi:hypothetical protein